MAFFLLKTEPAAYSFSDLEREGETVWDGVKNAQALRMLAEMQPGDRLVIYHSVTDKAAVGTARVVSAETSDSRQPRIRIAPVRRLAIPKSLASIRQHQGFARSPLFRQFRLSVVPLTEDQYRWLAAE